MSGCSICSIMLRIIYLCLHLFIFGDAMQYVTPGSAFAFGLLLRTCAYAGTGILGTRTNAGGTKLIGIISDATPYPF